MSEARCPACEFHARVLAVISELVALDPPADSPEGRLLSVLAPAVEEFEREHYPLDREEP